MEYGSKAPWEAGQPQAPSPNIEENWAIRKDGEGHGCSRGHATPQHKMPWSRLLEGGKPVCPEPGILSTAAAPDTHAPVDVSGRDGRHWLEQDLNWEGQRSERISPATDSSVGRPQVYGDLSLCQESSVPPATLQCSSLTSIPVPTSVCPP